MCKQFSRYVAIVAAVLTIAGDLSAQFSLPAPHLPFGNSGKKSGSQDASGDNGTATNGKDIITIVRDLPPAINLENTRISVEANVVPGVSPVVLQVLKARLVTSIQGDKRFIVDDKNPATIIKLTATTFEMKQGPPSTLGKFVFTPVNASLKVSLQVIDATKKTPLDSTNLESGFQKQYHTGPVQKILGVQIPLDRLPTMEEVMNDLVDDTTSKVTRRIARTKGTVSFKLPGGELKAYQDKMRHKEWVPLYDDLSVMNEPASADEKAARLYWMGISKEAPAYDMKDNAEARKSLLDADQHYKDAAALGTREAGEYQNSSRRTEEAIVLLAGASPNAVPDSGGAKSAGADTLTNTGVIDMVKQGVAAEFVLDAITDARSTAFDVSPKGLGELTQAHVPAEVIRAMREKSKKN